MKLYFVSKNEEKYNDIVKLMGNAAEIEHCWVKLEEIQSESIENIAKHKALDAYKKLRRPVVVEHSGLEISGFGDMPGGFTQIFWSRLGDDKFCSYLSGKGTASAVSVIAFCDGRKIHTFSGQVQGAIAEKPRGKNGFGWDCIFQPENDTRTFAEMDDGGISKKYMRFYAVEAFKKHLEGSQNDD